MVCALLEAGAAVNSAHDDGTSALLFASAMGHSEVSSDPKLTDLYRKHDKVDGFVPEMT